MLPVRLVGVSRQVLILEDTAANLSFGLSFFRATPKIVTPQESLSPRHATSPSIRGGIPLPVTNRLACVQQLGQACTCPH